MSILHQVRTSTPVRIVIADAEPNFRKNLQRALAAKPGIEILGEASDAALTARLAPAFFCSLTDSCLNCGQLARRLAQAARRRFAKS